MNNTTEQDVLKFLRSKCQESGCTDSCMHGDACCSLALAIHSIEKQIAKKPIFKFAYEDGRKFHDCPVCGSYVTHAFEQDQVKYCNCCGQKLDWE